MEEVLKNYFWIINLLVAMICAWLMASVFIALIGNFLQGSKPVAVTTGSNVVSQELSFSNNPRATQDILARNLFARDLSKKAGPSTPRPLVGKEAVKSELNYSLIGTVVTPYPENSIATLSFGKDHKRYKIGMKIEDKHEVQRIKRGRVEFINQSSGRLEFLAFPQRKMKPVRKRNRPSGLKLASQPVKGIVQKAPNSFSISRSEVDAALSNFDKLIRDAKAIPNNVNGQLKGFRIVQIKPGSIYTKLGIVNGDIITNVNGDELDSINEAMGLLEVLKTQSNFKIKLNRNGRDTEMTYEIT